MYLCVCVSLCVCVCVRMTEKFLFNSSTYLSMAPSVGPLVDTVGPPGDPHAAGCLMESISLAGTQSIFKRGI